MRVKFTQNAVKKYLDDCIRFWRKESLKHISKRKNFLSINVVRGYVDVFQSVRESLFGKKLK